MKVITDNEFGDIKLLQSARAARISIKMGTDGRLRASMPPRTPLRLITKLVDNSRPAIREIVLAHRNAHSFTDGMQVGKSHTLIVRPATSSALSVSSHGQQIIVSLPDGMGIEDQDAQGAIRDTVLKALRKEAKSYLPRRLRFLADKNNLSYSKVRLSHASSRWGSCSSSGTISLNIALMKLPFHLIDYVILHELSHTVELNHSDAFWSLVERCDPNYEQHRKEIKQYAPTI